MQLMALIASMLMFASCNAIMDGDLPECKTTFRVHLKYDYNIQRSDMFSDHAGWVRLFVIDDNTNLVVKEVTVSNRDNGNIIKHHPNSQTFYIDLEDLTPGASYRFAAIALQRPYDETMSHAEDKFVANFPAPRADIKDLAVSLTRNETPDAQGYHHVTAPECGLDTLWMGHTTKAKALPVANNAHTYVADTVSMVRDTKYLHVSLRNMEKEAAYDMDASNFRLEIVDNNSDLLWDNEINTSKSDRLLYSPHAQFTMEEDVRGPYDTDPVMGRAAHYNISFSRLMYYAEASKNARMRIYNIESGDAVVDIDLAYFLSQGRHVGHYIYKEQEYLDREYEYRMDFWLQNGNWLYTRVNIMPWAIRNDNIVLE